MVNWAVQKQKARDKVHRTLGVPAYYTPVSEVDNELYEPSEVTARFHQKTGYIGDEYSGDFNPGLISQINRVILDTTEVPNPLRGDTLRFPDYEDVTVMIENRTWQGQNKVVCEVYTE